MSLTMHNRLIKLFKEGYNWKPYTPYSAPESLKILRGIHNVLGIHYRNRDGSWCFGYDFVCGCGMYVGLQSEKKRQAAADAINKLPSEMQQEAAAKYSNRY